MTQPFAFTQADRESPLWRRLEAHMNDRIATLREQNDADKNPDATAHLRGRIAELKTLLDLARDRHVTSTRAKTFPAAG